MESFAWHKQMECYLRARRRLSGAKGKPQPTQRHRARAQSKIRTALLLADAVQRVVALTLVADRASDGDVGRLARDDLAVLVNVRDGDLNRGVVLGLNETASGSALAGDVKVNKLSLRGQSRRTCVTHTWMFSMVMSVCRQGWNGEGAPMTIARDAYSSSIADTSLPKQADARR